MPRRPLVLRQKVVQDSRFKDQTVGRFLNILLKDGKKSTAERVGGASYQVPVEIRPVRQVALALRWIKQSALARSGKSMREKLAAELMDAANNNGSAVKKRDETHRMAEANRAFAHYRW